MPRVEIRWKERKPDPDETTFDGYIKSHSGVDDVTAVERTFESWLDDKIEGRCGVVIELEIYVDGEHYELSMGEKNRLLQKVGDAALIEFPQCDADET